MELISEKIGALGSAVAVVDAEKRASGPKLRLLELWLDDVEDDGHAVFVVVADDALVGVGGVGRHHAVLLGGELRRLVRLDKGPDWVEERVGWVWH